MRLLFVVEDLFEVKERGLIAAGKLVDPGPVRYYIGDSVEVRRKDGIVVPTQITGIPMGLMKAGWVEIFLRGINKGDVQPGDEVWIEERTKPQQHVN